MPRTQEEISEHGRRAAEKRWGNNPKRWARPELGFAFVYVLGPEFGPYKIGYTDWVPARRQGIQDAHWVAIKLVFEQRCPKAQAIVVEKRAHVILREWRIRGEWFAVSPREAIAAIRQAYAEIVGLDDDVI